MGFWGKLAKNGVTLEGFLRLVVLICSIVLIGCISYDTFVFSNPFEQTPFTQKVQLWVCVFFMLDLALEFLLSHHKRRYFFSYFLLFIACIPYLTILPMLHLSVPRDLEYVLRFMPLIRSTYALGIVIGWFTYKASAKLFFTYVFILFSGIYIGSMAFYVCEVNVNPLVKTYWDALWWAAMESITVGCNIEAVTTVGKVLSVVVAILGLLIIPMFTVYVTNIVGILQQVTHESEQKTASEKEEKKQEKVAEKAKNS